MIEEDMTINYYIFKKKLLFIQFYRMNDMSYEEIAYILDSHPVIVEFYCEVILNEI